MLIGSGKELQKLLPQTFWVTRKPKSKKIRGSIALWNRKPKWDEKLRTWMDGCLVFSYENCHDSDDLILLSLRDITKNFRKAYFVQILIPIVETEPPKKDQ